MTLAEKVHEESQIFFCERLVEEGAESKAEKTTFSNRSFMASNCWNNEVVEHGDEISILLKIAFNILEHALYNVQTLHVDHDFSDGLFLSSSSDVSVFLGPCLTW